MVSWLKRKVGVQVTDIQLIIVFNCFLFWSFFHGILRKIKGASIVSGRKERVKVFIDG